ncbi:hypothetical protein Tco_1341348 [Tanacetum coccineum]
MLRLVIVHLGGRGKGSGGCVNEASGSGMGTNGGGTRDGGTSSRGGETSSRGRGRGIRGGETTSSGGRRGGGRGSRGVGSTRGSGMAENINWSWMKRHLGNVWKNKPENKQKIDVEQERLDKERREEQEREENNDYFNPVNWREDSMEESGVWVKDTTDVTFEDIGEAPAMTTSETTDVAEASVLEESPVDKGKGKESLADEASGTKKRSERIANMELKKPFQFDKHGTGSTPEKAFDVDD